MRAAAEAAESRNSSCRSIMFSSNGSNNLCLLLLHGSIVVVAKCPIRGDRTACSVLHDASRSRSRSRSRSIAWCRRRRAAGMRHIVRHCRLVICLSTTRVCCTQDSLVCASHRDGTPGHENERHSRRVCRLVAAASMMILLGHLGHSCPCFRCRLLADSTRRTKKRQ
jgi:hypothetical protein